MDMPENTDKNPFIYVEAASKTISQGSDTLIFNVKITPKKWATTTSQIRTYLFESPITQSSKALSRDSVVVNYK